MLQVILILDIFLGVSCLFLRRKGKIVSILLLIFMLINFSAAQSTVDSYAYSTAFIALKNGASFEYVTNMNFGIDIGFLAIMKIVSLITSDYMVFRGMIFVISFFFIIKAISRIDKTTIICLTLYMLFPFEYDCFQIEFFLAYSLVAYGLTLLIQENERNVLKYIIIVIIATLIHKYAILFVLFLLIKLDSKQLRKVITGFVIGFLVLNIFLRINMVALINRILPFLNNVLSLGHYVTGDSLNILTIIMSISLFLAIYYYSYFLKSEDSNLEIDNLFVINSISLLFLPFIFTSLNFERYLRPLLVINYAYINKTAVLYNKKLRSIELVIVAMVIFRFSIHWSYYMSNIQDVLHFVFGNN